MTSTHTLKHNYRDGDVFVNEVTWLAYVNSAMIKRHCVQLSFHPFDC